MPIKINCIKCINEKCLSENAPKNIFFKSLCVFLENNNDKRVKITCVEQIKYPMPIINPPMPPKKHG